MRRILLAAVLSSPAIGADAPVTNCVVSLVYPANKPADVTLVVHTPTCTAKGTGIALTTALGKVLKVLESETHP